MRQEAALQVKQLDGTTRRDHLEAAARMGHLGARATLNAAETPEPTEYLEMHLGALHGRSGMSMSGPEPLKWSELESYTRMTGARITHDDALAIMSCDTLLLQLAEEHRPKNKPAETSSATPTEEEDDG